MKIELNQNIVISKLSIDVRPVLVGKKIEYEPAKSQTPYIIFDSHKDAPTGFGVKVGATKKTYILQRKIGDKVIKSKIGNVSDFLNITDAREKAKEHLQTMLETGRNPNAVSKEISASEITMGKAFSDYRNFLEHKQPPAKPNTFKVFDKAVKALSSWEQMKVRELTANIILERFDEIAATYRTSAEQHFRWANVAVKHAINNELFNANNEQREATLTHNPFSVLSVQKRYRSRQELEKVYQAKGIRTPLETTKESLGAFLNAAWGKRKNDKKTGADYVLLTLLWGTRKNEPLGLKWRDLITEQEAVTSSYVDLNKNIVFFYDTKNRTNHTLPLCVAALEILQQRQEDNLERGNPRWRGWVYGVQPL